MATLQTLDQRILDHLGDTISGDVGITQDMLDDWVTQGYQYIVMLVYRVAPQRLHDFAAGTSLTDGNGLTLSSLTSLLIGNVTRTGRNGRVYPCRQIPASIAGLAANPHFYFYAMQYDPVWYLEEQTLYVLPEPTSDQEVKAYHVKFKAIDASEINTINSAADIACPPELDEAIIWYATCQALLREMSYGRRQIESKLDAVSIDSFDWDNTTIVAAFTKAADLIDTDFDSEWNSFTWDESKVLDALTKADSLIDTDFDTALGNITWIDTYILDAMDKADSLIDTDFDAEFNDDDVEMAASAIQAAQTEVSRVAAAIRAQEGELQELVQKAELAIRAAQVESTRAQMALENERAQSQDSLNRAQSTIQAAQAETQRALAAIQAQQGELQEATQEAQLTLNQVQLYMANLQQVEMAYSNGLQQMYQIIGAYLGQMITSEPKSTQGAKA